MKFLQTKNPNHTLMVLGFVMIALMLLFVLFHSDFDTQYIIPKRLLRLLAIIIGSGCIALSVIIFQTLTTNKILTPAVMGYESIYILWQALLLLVFGTPMLSVLHDLHPLLINLGSLLNFVSSLLIMLLYAWVLHYRILPFCRQNIYLLLLFGIVTSIVLSTLSQFLQLLINPAEFSIFQSMTYTSFNRADVFMLSVGAIGLLAVAVYIRSQILILDVLALGKDWAMSLGVDYEFYVRRLLVCIAILVAISTSLIGLTAFMGIFIANIAYVLSGTSKHKYTLPIATLVAMGIFIIAQLLVEHIFNYKTTVSILVNLLCGSYFLSWILYTRREL
ncbi:iron chelate uptake ABC transporter family permease subunit [Moraxella marmotae]|uniref:iron chelate uptake ABC transporter family permease subunit n=1 Tax=Moraxella marmotae TaxID=3344520 RepID=UPI0035F44B64